MGIDRISDWGKGHTHAWRGTKRVGHVRFGNVRRMGEEHLHCAEDHDFRIVVAFDLDGARKTVAGGEG